MWICISSQGKVHSFYWILFYWGLVTQCQETLSYAYDKTQKETELNQGWFSE